METKTERQKLNRIKAVLAETGHTGKWLAEQLGKDLLLVNLFWQLEAQKSYLTAPDKRGTREISTTGGVSRRTVGLPTNSRQATAVRAAAKRDSAGREPWLTPVA